MATPVTPQHVIVSAMRQPLPSPSVLGSSARYLVPKVALPEAEVMFVSEWTPSAVVKQVPGAMATALTPKALADRFSPATIAQSWVQDLATAAIVAVLL